MNLELFRSKIAISRLSTKPIRYLPLFAPAILFFSLAIAILVAPALVLGLISAFFLFLGGVTAILIYKAIIFKKKVEKHLADFKGRISVQAFHVVEPKSQTVEVDQKKIIWH